MIEDNLKYIQTKFHEMAMELQRYRTMESIRPFEELAEVFQRERKRQNLTLKGLAELSGVSYSTLVRLESGNDGIHLKTVKQAADTLGLRLWIG